MEGLSTQIVGSYGRRAESVLGSKVTSETALHCTVFADFTSFMRKIVNIYVGRYVASIIDINIYIYIYMYMYSCTYTYVGRNAEYTRLIQGLYMYEHM